MQIRTSHAGVRLVAESTVRAMGPTARAANDAHFVEVTRAFADLHEGFGDASLRAEFRCECAESCEGVVAMTFDEYESVRGDVSHVVVAPGHAPADSAIVARRSRFEVVEPPPRT